MNWRARLRQMMLAGGVAAASGCGNAAALRTIGDAGARQADAGPASADALDAPGTGAAGQGSTTIYPCNGNPDPCCQVYLGGLDASAHVPQCWSRIETCAANGGTFDLADQICVPGADAASGTADAPEVNPTTDAQDIPDAGDARDAATARADG
jgi:hypothetical protein